MVLEKRNRKVLSYLITKLKEKGMFKGKIHVMKLMFLIEHYDIEKNRIVGRGFIGNDFRIYYLGPFSFEVSEAYDNLKIEKNVRIGRKLRERIDKIIEMFGNKSWEELERFSLELLGIKSWEKSKYFGIPIKEILEK